MILEYIVSVEIDGSQVGLVEDEILDMIQAALLEKFPYNQTEVQCVDQ